MRSDFPRPRARRRESAINFVVTRRTRSPRPIRNRSKDPDTCRQSSIAQTRSPPSLRAQTHQRSKPFGADLDRLLAHQLARRRRRRRRSCATACECPHRARSLTSSTSTSIEWTSGGHGLLGAVPRSYQVTPEHPRPATSDTTKGGQATPADSLKESQLAARSGPSPPRRTSPTPQIETASLEAPVLDATPFELWRPRPQPLGQGTTEFRTAPPAPGQRSPPFLWVQQPD